MHMYVWTCLNGGYVKQWGSSVLGTERPDWRWLIIGPARSGSAFHVDPNQVSLSPSPPSLFHFFLVSSWLPPPTHTHHVG